MFMGMCAIITCSCCTEVSSCILLWPILNSLGCQNSSLLNIQTGHVVKQSQKICRYSFILGSRKIHFIMFASDIKFIRPFWFKGFAATWRLTLYLTFHICFLEESSLWLYNTKLFDQWVWWYHIHPFVSASRRKGNYLKFSQHAIQLSVPDEH